MQNQETKSESNTSGRAQVEDDVTLYNYVDHDLLKYYMTYLQVLIFTEMSFESLQFLLESKVNGFGLNHQYGCILYFEVSLFNEELIFEVYEALRHENTKLVCFRQFVLGVNDRLQNDFVFYNVTLNKSKNDVVILTELPNYWNNIYKVRQEILEKKAVYNFLKTTQLSKSFFDKCMSAFEVPTLDMFCKLYNNENLVNMDNRFHEVFMCHSN